MKQQKQTARIGTTSVGAFALVMAGCVAAGGLFSNPTYAAEGEAGNVPVVMAADENKPELSEQEARAAAEKLVTTIKRLEVTPDYQKMVKLSNVRLCTFYDQNPNIQEKCERKTELSDVANVLIEILPEKEAEIKAAEQGGLTELDNYARDNIPFDNDWGSLLSGVNYVYEGLQMQSEDEAKELTIENITEIILEHGSAEYWGGQWAGIPAFWDGLLTLQGDTWSGKIARIYDTVSDTRWVQLVRHVEMVSDGIASGDVSPWANSGLAMHLSYWIGNNAYYLTPQQKVARAQDLSDYGQAKALYDVLEKVTGAGMWGGCLAYSIQQTYSVPAQKALYEDLLMKAKLLYPQEVASISDYHLVVADLPQDDGNENGDKDGNVTPPALPNTGAVGNGGPTAILATLSAAVMGVVAAVAGAAVIAKLYAKRIKFKK